MGDYSPSLTYKLKKSICCCFKQNPLSHHQHHNPPSNSPDSSAGHTPRLLRSSSQWIKQRSHEFPEIKDKCRNLIHRIGTKRRAHSTDFRYDPLSYALNFDEGDEDEQSDVFPLRNFSSRLPQSPPSSGTGRSKIGMSVDLSGGNASPVVQPPKRSVSEGAAVVAAAAATVGVSREITACS